MFQNWSVIAALALVPFLMFSDRILHEGQGLAMAILSLVVASSYMRSWPARLLGLYLAARISWDFFAVLTGAQTLQFALDGFGMLMWFLVAAVICLGTSMSTAPKPVFYNAFCLLALSQCLLVAFQLVGIDLFMGAYNLFTYIPCLSRLTENAPVGSLGNPNFVSAYMAICAPFFLRGSWRWGLIPIALALAVCHTSTAVFAAGCGLAYYFYDRNRLRWFVVAVASLVMIVGIFMASDWESVFRSQRWWLWIVGTEGILHSRWTVLFGNGMGAKTGISFPLHNDWMQLWFYVGAVGVSLAAWWVLTMLRTKDRVLKAAVVVAAVNAVGNYPFHLAPSTVLIMTIFGLIERDMSNRPRGSGLTKGGRK